MYPYFNLWGMHRYMTGIGIVVSSITFVGGIWILCRRYRMDFGRFFVSLPLLIFAMYILWVWSYHIINHNIWFPSSRSDTISFFSPYGYHIHFVWLVVGFFIGIGKFLYSTKLETHIKRRSIWFFWTAASMIPLGLFLTLGDNFVGKPNPEWFFAVGALSPESTLNDLGKVYPVGILLSLISLISIIIMYSLRKIGKIGRIWLMWFGLWSLLMHRVFTYQLYDKHLVMTAWWITRDIKNYILIASTLTIVYLYYFYRKNI